jgi:hypothetical protein
VGHLAHSNVERPFEVAQVEPPTTDLQNSSTVLCVTLMTESRSLHNGTDPLLSIKLPSLRYTTPPPVNRKQEVGPARLPWPGFESLYDAPGRAAGWPGWLRCLRFARGLLAWPRPTSAFSFQSEHVAQRPSALPTRAEAWDPGLVVTFDFGGGQLPCLSRSSSHPIK